MLEKINNAEDLKNLNLRPSPHNINMLILFSLDNLNIIPYDKIVSSSRCAYINNS